MVTFLLLFSIRYLKLLLKHTTFLASNTLKKHHSGEHIGSNEHHTKEHPTNKPKVNPHSESGKKSKVKESNNDKPKQGIKQ